MITILDALDLVKKIQPKLQENNLNCALTGSVLFSGKSEKDIDLIVYQHSFADGVMTRAAVRKILEKIGFVPNTIMDKKLASGVKNNAGNRVVDIYTFDILYRVDVFLDAFPMETTRFSSF